MKRPLPIAAGLTMAALLTMAATSAAQEETVPPAADASVEAPAPAAAEAPAVAGPLAGNAETGRTLSYTCQGCHGVTGYKNAYPNFHVPLIGGQSEAYLVQALSEYKQGNRKHPTMQAQAQSFSDQDIADLAAYLSSLKK